jgi:hypothetical protein
VVDGRELIFLKLGERPDSVGKVCGSTAHSATFLIMIFDYYLSVPEYCGKVCVGVFRFNLRGSCKTHNSIIECLIFDNSL